MSDNLFLFSKKGRANVISSILLTALHNLIIMLPIVLLIFLAWEMIKGNGTDLNIFLYTGAAFLILIAIYWSYRFAYRKIYISAYGESANTRINLAEKIRKLPLSYFGKKNLSDLSSTLMDDTAVVENALTTAVSELFGGIISSIIILVVLFFFDWRMGLSLFICLPASLFLLYVNLLLSPAINWKNRNAKLSVSESVQEFLENIKVLYASSKRVSYRLDVEKNIRRVVKTSMLYELVVGVFVSGAYNILRTGLGLVVVTGAWLFGNGEISLFIFLVFLFAAAKVYDPLTVVFFIFAEYVYALVSQERISQLRDYPVLEGSTQFNPDSWNIEFENVSFGYNGDTVIHDISFIAKQGQITALAGPSGSGKTTLSKLACRFWDVRKGKILIGGIDIKGVDPETLLQFISIVFQDVVLFNDTIFNNIKIGKKDASKEEIITAAKMAGCEDFIKDLPDGYRTIIGENGKTLSGGERQRISIARAFLKDAPIILLDEATASLDPENEKLIQKAISRLIKDKTVLIIAHRLQLIENCHQIIVLNQGRLVEKGCHGDLIGFRGLYHKLFKLQKESLEWKAGT